MVFFEGLQHALLWIAIFMCFGAYTFRKKRRYNLPPGPRGLPLVGILPFLGKNPHVELFNLGKKYGSIFSVYFGRTYAVVIADAALGKQVQSTTSATDRPPNLFGEIPDGVGVTQHSGLEWTEQRRYVIMQMKNLGLGKSNWETLVQMEVADVLDLITQSQGKPLDIKGILAASISNNVIALITNNRLPMGDPRRDIIDRGVESFQRLNNQSGFFVHFHKLYKLAVYFGLLDVKEEMENITNMNKYIRQEVDKSRRNKEDNSFIDKYLKEIEKNQQMNLKNSFTETNLVGNVQSLVIAGSDTTFVSAIWLLLAMAAFSEKQEKVHEELDSVLGKDGTTDWSERHKLPYCVATIMEGQRWRTVAPLNIQHCANEDFVVNGYDIPKGTNIMTLLWGYHYDTKYWEDPDEFQPERFLSDDGTTIKEQEAYLPFSFGKRRCPGKTVAYIELFHYFVGIMQKFRVLPESDAKFPNLEGFPGLTLQPKRQPLRFIPR